MHQTLRRWDQTKGLLNSITDSFNYKSRHRKGRIKNPDVISFKWTQCQHKLGQTKEVFFALPTKTIVQAEFSFQRTNSLRNFFLLVKCHLPFSSFICLKKLCVRDSFEPSRILVFIKAGQNCNLSNQTNQHFVFSFLCPENVQDLVLTISLLCIGLQKTHSIKFSLEEELQEFQI